MRIRGRPSPTPGVDLDSLLKAHLGPRTPAGKVYKLGSTTRWNSVHNKSSVECVERGWNIQNPFLERRGLRILSAHVRKFVRMQRVRHT